MDLNLKSGLKLDMSKIPVWIQAVVLAIIPIAAAVAFFFLQYQPKQTTIDGLIATIQKQQNDISVKRAKAMRLEELKKENEWLKGQLKALTEQLPEEAEISGLLRQISDLCKSADLEILSWVPAKKKAHPSGLYEEIPVAMTLTGTYHKLGMFFSKISSMLRIVNVSGLKIAAVAKKQHLNLGFTTTAFTRAATPPPEEIKGKQPKKGASQSKPAPKEGDK